MTLLADERLAAIPPRVASIPPSVTGAGQEAIDLAASVGLDLDPWQREALTASLGEAPDGRWASPEVAMVVCRQNGKGVVLEARELAGLFLFDERFILHTAHEFKTCTSAFRRLLAHIDGAPDLRKRVKRVLQNNVEMSIELRNGARAQFVARTSGSGRGFTVDCLILDEAYKLPASVMAALLPTVTARPNPQVWYSSSAPLPGSESDVLRRVCRRGRAGDDPRLAYLEWSAHPDADLDDRVVWRGANPGRAEEDALAMARGAMSDEEFAREHLGIFPDDVGQTSWLVVPEQAWQACELVGHKPTGELRYCLDVDSDARGVEWASIGCSDGTHVEIVTPPGAGPGVDWVVEACAAKRDVVRELLVLPDGPAGRLIPALEQAGVAVRKMKPQEFAQASAGFLDAVEQGRVRHIGQPVLTTAVAGADRRSVGDGAWRFSRKLSVPDIGPLNAVVVARWVADSDSSLTFAY